MTGVRIRGDRVELRPLAPEDAAPLREMLATPQVAAWWPTPQRFPFGDDPDSTRLAIVHEDRLVGMIQFAEELDPDYRHASIDVFLDPAVHGRGLGTDAVDALARHLMRERGHHRVTIDPALENAAAIRCYEKAGFRAVGVMRAYERDPLSGRWRDGLLMERVELPG